jgi:hypothetical protein
VAAMGKARFFSFLTTMAVLQKSIRILHYFTQIISY